jgi:hypothetical protein
MKMSLRVSAILFMIDGETFEGAITCAEFFGCKDVIDEVNDAFQKQFPGKYVLAYDQYNRLNATFKSEYEKDLFLLRTAGKVWTRGTSTYY